MIHYNYQRYSQIESVKKHAHRISTPKSPVRFYLEKSLMGQV